MTSANQRPGPFSRPIDCRLGRRRSVGTSNLRPAVWGWFEQLALVLAIAAPPTCGPLPARGDVFGLSSGGTGCGQVVAADDRELQLQMASGAMLTLPQAAVRTRQSQPVIEDEHALQWRLTPETPAGYCELAEWCRQHGLPGWRRSHLQSAIELDTDWEPARRALGYTRQTDGRWMTREEVAEEAGLVRYDGKYMSPEEVAIREREAADAAAEIQWHRDVRSWMALRRSRDVDKRDAAEASMRAIRDPLALRALGKFVADHPDENQRLYYLSIVSAIPGQAATQALVTSAVADVSRNIREAAIEHLQSPERPESAELLAGYLANATNLPVRRAAYALGKLDSAAVVPELIAALRTVHRYRVSVPVPPTAGFSRSGNTVGPASVPVLPPELEAQWRTGQLPQGFIVVNSTPSVMRDTIVSVQHDNLEVLEALVELTGENFGFDERRWQAWWLEQTVKN